MSFKPKNPNPWAPEAFTIIYPDGGTATLAVKGRDKWALLMLLAAGPRGCTPITNPAPRWSAYIHKLRQAGVLIETIHETHDGAFAGHHARYVLRCSIRASKSHEVAA